MIQTLSKILNKFLVILNIRIVKNSSFVTIQHLASQSGNKELEFLKAMPRHFSQQILNDLPNSKAQLRQDLFALSMLGFKKSGYFVEFGATNGIDRSNSYLLESEYSWDGILAEPANSWHLELHKNRKCSISTKCVWKTTGESLQFLECDFKELSTIESYGRLDSHAKNRANARTYPVNTISLLDLLLEFNAPTQIDFLSIDTEGSELDILQAFDFSRYRFSVIACEHNFGPTREKICELLAMNG